MPDPATFRVYECPRAQNRDDARNISEAEGGFLFAGRHLLSVPPGAVRGNPRLQMREHAGQYLVVSFRPLGERFERTALLTLSTARCAGTVPAPTRVIRYRPGTGWQEVQSRMVEAAGQEGRMVREHTVQVELDGFSSYALVAP